MLNALRKQRNLSDYSGDLIADSAAAECLASVIDLLAHVRAWSKAHRPDGMTLDIVSLVKDFRLPRSPCRCVGGRPCGLAGGLSGARRSRGI